MQKKDKEFDDVLNHAREYLKNERQSNIKR